MSEVVAQCSPPLINTMHMHRQSLIHSVLWTTVSEMALSETEQPRGPYNSGGILSWPGASSRFARTTVSTSLFRRDNMGSIPMQIRHHITIHPHLCR